MQIFVISNLGGHSDNVANAVLNDDSEGVANSHQSFSDAQQQILAFAEHWGAEVLSYGEDGCFAFEVENPEMFLNDLQALKEHIGELSGHELTLGVGSQLSDAGKAFLYAKINDNSELSVYDPAMDEELSQMGNSAQEEKGQEPYYEQDQNEESDGQNQLEEFKEFHNEESDDDQEGNSDVQNLPSESDEVGEPEGNTQGEIHPEESENGDFSNESEHDENAEEPVDQIDYKDEDGEQEEYKPFLDGADANTTNVAIAGNEQDASNTDIGKSPYHPSAEINAGAPKEGSIEVDHTDDPDHMEEDSESYNEEAEADGEPENEEPELEEKEPLEESEEIVIPDSKEQKELQRQQDEDQEANENGGLNHSEDEAVEENPDLTLDEDADEYEDNALVNPESEGQEGESEEMVEEVPPEEENMLGDIEQGSQEVGDPDSPMPEEEQVMGDSMEPTAEDEEYEMAQEMADEEQASEEIRNQIGAALDGFRSQKEALMAMQDQAPELYQATLVLLQTLIQMSNLIFGQEEQQEPMYEPAEEEIVEENPIEEEAESPQSYGKAL